MYVAACVCRECVCVCVTVPVSVCGCVLGCVCVLHVCACVRAFIRWRLWLGPAEEAPRESLGASLGPSSFSLHSRRRSCPPSHLALPVPSPSLLPFLHSAAAPAVCPVAVPGAERTGRTDPGPVGVSPGGRAAETLRQFRRCGESAFFSRIKYELVSRTGS